MDALTLRVAARYAAMSEEKLEILLQKLRKGATSSLTWGSLTAVLESLDSRWKVEKTVGIVKLYRDADHPERFDGTFEEVERRIKESQQYAVTSLPSKPKHGQLYFMDMSGPIEHPTRKGTFYFTVRPWMGHQSWTITAPTGKSFEAIPGQYDFGTFYHKYNSGVRSRGKISLFGVVPWLNKETDWIDQINKKLDLDAHEPAVPRTRQSTGSCPVCFQNIKAKPKVVLHGYKRPGHGSTEGNCFGYGYLPFEVSKDGTKDYLEKVLEPQLKGVKAKLKDIRDGLKSGDFDSIPQRRGRPDITPDNPGWQRAVEGLLYTLERDLKFAESDVRVYSTLVRRWKKRPLPKEGEPHIDWFLQGRK